VAAAPIIRAWSYHGAPEAEFAEESLNDLLVKTSYALDGLLAMKNHGRIAFGRIEHDQIEHGQIKKAQEELTKLRQAGAGFISA
jgi:hypothetical protein